MKPLIRRNVIKVSLFSASYLLVGFICMVVFHEIGVSTDDLIDESAFVTALNGYFGEWEIIEDFGYRGIHIYPPEEALFDVGGRIYFDREVFRYEGVVERSYPNYSIEFTTTAIMGQIDKISDLTGTGFSADRVYAKIIVRDIFDNINSTVDCVLYILNDNEIMINRQSRNYRAIKKE